ncbi:MAG: CCA tRNA nucleotidyltransferase [Bacteroidales bacterium]|nr:CCA tRNA nucleotidyltransferase [Bacteroidales bacterium]
MDVQLDNPIYAIVGRVADQLGIQAYAVGGVVRDYFLGRHCTDIDVVCIRESEKRKTDNQTDQAVVSVGIELAEASAEAVNNSGTKGLKASKVSVFKSFGTASFHFRHNDEDWQVEFVGARRESYRADSRKPIVENGTLEDDQNRRDFTVNAMAVSLNAATYGNLVDPFGGIRDLDAGIIRTPLAPDITFSDDPLRMMRAIRFATQLGFRIEDETFAAIARNAGRIAIVSRERITVEINKIMLSPTPSIGFKLLEKSGLLPIIFPELSALKGTETVDGRSHKDNFYHTLEVLDHVAANSDDLWLRWAALLHDIGKPATKRYDAKIGWTFHGHEVRGSRMVKKIFTNLRLPLDAKMKYVEKLVLLHLRPIILSEDEVTDSAVRRLLFDAGDDIDDLMTLCEADITSKNEAKVRRYLANFVIVRQKLVELEEKDRIRNFQPPVSGDDIMRTFNLQPCHEIGIIKDAIKDAILDGRIPNDRDAAWQMMLAEAAKLGLTPVAQQ